MRRLAPFRHLGGVFVCADRVGSEGTTNFCGSSCVLSGTSRVVDGQLLGAGALGSAEEGVLVTEVEVPEAKPGDVVRTDFYGSFSSTSSEGSVAETASDGAAEGEVMAAAGGR